MDTERTQETVTPEVWAAAQVDAAARGLLLPEKPKRAKAAPVKVRGVYFKPRPAGEALGPTGERGEWWASYYDGDGGRHREKCGTRSQAVAVYQRRKSEVRQGRLFPENMRKVQAVTLAAVCKSYLAALAANGRDLRGQVKTRLAEVQAIMGDVPAASVRPQDIGAVKVKLAEAEARGRGRTRRPASVNRYVQDVRAAFNVARRNGLVDKNPVADVRLLHENNKRVRRGDGYGRAGHPGGPGAHYAAVSYRPAARVVRFLTLTGLRLGEACGLKWGDVDFRAEVATLTKTKAGKVQHIPLSVEALGILRNIGPGDGGGFVFGWPDGRPWTSGYMTHEFHKAAVKAGVADVHVHDLRHTAACRWLRAGVDI